MSAHRAGVSIAHDCDPMYLLKCADCDLFDASNEPELLDAEARRHRIETGHLRAV